MASTARTALRGGLVIGGLALAAMGVVDGSNFDLAVGVVSAVVGAVGLWMAIRGGDREATDE